MQLLTLVFRWVELAKLGATGFPAPAARVGRRAVKALAFGPTSGELPCFPHKLPVSHGTGWVPHLWFLKPVCHCPLLRMGIKVQWFEKQVLGRAVFRPVLAGFAQVIIS